MSSPAPTPLLWSAVLAALLLPGAPLLAQDGPEDEPKPAEQEAQAKEESQEPDRGKDTARSRRTFRVLPRPSLRLGNVLRVDFRAKFQLDFRDFTPAQKSHDEDLFELHRARIGIQGRVLHDFEYEVEHELGDAKNPWRDFYVNYRHFRRAQIQVGKFKIPFGMEELTGPTNLDFIFRSRPSKYLAPARSRGGEIHGRFFERGLNYQLGFFRHDGENAFDAANEPTGQRTFAGRVTAAPMRLLPLPKFLQSIEIGQAFTESAVPEGRKGLRGKTFAKKTFFDHYDVRGHRLRLGSEMRWFAGPFSVKGEFIHVRDQRQGQGLAGEDLPDLIARGWYLAGTWVVTGEAKAGGVRPRRDFLTGKGAGALELAARYEQLRFGSAEHEGRPSRSFRAANLVSNSDRVWTVGANWYLNRWLKVQVNGMRDKLEDPLRFPLAGSPKYWVKVLRLQIVI